MYRSLAIQPMPAPQLSADTVYVRSGLRYHHIPLSEILFAEAQKNFCNITTCRQRFMVLATMAELEAVLAPPQFYRIHRSFIVNMAYVKSFDRRNVRVAEQELPIGATYLGAFLRARPLIGSPRSVTHATR